MSSTVESTKLNGGSCGDVRLLASADFDRFDAAKLRAVLRACERQRSAIAAVEHRAIRSLREHSSSARATQSELEASGWSRRRANQSVETARRLGDLEAAAEALERGEIGVDHARQLARAAKQHRDAAIAEQSRLLDAARSQSPDEFASTVNNWVNEHDSDDGQKRLDRQKSRRQASTYVRNVDGMGVIHAEHDPITHASLSAIIAKWADALWREEDPKSRRQPKQRVADAIANLIRFADSARDGAPVDGVTTPAGPPVSIVIIANYDALTRQLTAELPDGTPVPIEEFVKLAVKANIVPAVFDSQGQPLWLGRRRRLPNTAQRLAAIARDRTCGVRGCAVRHSWTQLHHIIWWSLRGNTDIDNLVLLCSHHHHQIHDDGHILRRDRSGQWILAPP